VAFNALAHLSEEMPATAARENPPGEAGTPPRSISAEQSAALLKTLDELAGDDIRIEDTGVEWRVIDGDEDEEIAEDPVPNIAHEEMRFDDNTPLPDDFDLDMPATPLRTPEPVDIEPEPQIEESQVDLVFGEPDEWEDLLDDLEEAAAELEKATPEPAEEIEVVEAIPVDDEGDPDDVATDGEDQEADLAYDELQALDMDAQFARQAEKLGLDMTGLQKAVDEDEAAGELASEQEVTDDGEEEGPLDVGDTSIEEDLIAAAFEVEAAAKANAETEPEALEIEIEAIEFDDNDEINLEGVAPEELSRAGILDEDDYLEEITEEDEAEVLDEIELDDSPADRALAEAVFDKPVIDEPEIDEAEIEEPELEEAVEMLADEPAAEDISESELDDTMLEAAELEDEAQLPNEHQLAADLEKALDDMDDGDFIEPEEIEVPEPTEEERTINMMIDQELLAIAGEDDDGFTSTIVQKQVSSEADLPAEKDLHVADDETNDDTDTLVDMAENDDIAATLFDMPAGNDNPLMETIIMEGESVINEEDQERLEAARAAASESLKKAGFNDEKAKFRFRDWRPPPHSMAAAAALLFVILITQVIHQSREALAVSPAFQNTLGPVYRLFGSPVTPAWDVAGWRFEATKGSTDDDNNVLTIYSRVGNNSQQSLPYPLVHVELKDRFEEIVGSRVLEPGEYLVDDADPGRPVRPKETFNAVIAIDSPSAAATSFKLNVCYRIGGGQLRCDDKDFR
jgi:hypothetical protein